MILYHSTDTHNVDSILREGLFPSSVYAPTGKAIQPKVFLARTPFWAAMYGGDVVLKVTIRNRSKLHRSWLGDSTHEYLYDGVVPPEDIKVLGDAGEILSDYNELD